MNNKIKLGLVAVVGAIALCACSDGSADYIPDATDADYAALNTMVIAHPGLHCVMEWGNGAYVSNCYPATMVLPYSVHVYYPRGCGCSWPVAARPANYRPVYVNKTVYQRTVINKQTTVNNRTVVNNTKTSSVKPPQDAVPKGYTGRSSSSVSRSVTTSGRR